MISCQKSRIVTSVTFCSLEESHQVQPTLEGGSSFHLLHGGVLKNLWVYFKATTLGILMTLFLPMGVL